MLYGEINFIVKARIVVSNSMHIPMYILFSVSLLYAEDFNTFMHNNANKETRKETGRYMQHFSLLQYVTFLCLKM